MKRKMKHVMSTIMVTTLLMTIFFPALLSAANSDSQIEYAGGTVYYNAAGQQVSASALGENNSVVSLTKTAKGTDMTNEFIIDLKVETTVDITKVKSSADAAVVLVLDVSGSMNDETPKKIDVLKQAATNFLDDFSQATAGTSRYVSLVTYNNIGKINTVWTDITDPANLSSLKASINGLTADAGTNIQAGLLLARNLLSSAALSTLPKNVPNLSTILFTDGLANIYCQSSTYTGYTAGSQIVGYNEFFGDVPKATSGANAAASQIKASGTKLYTIAFGSDADKKWLATSIATNSTYAFTASNAGDLNMAFDSITQSIERWAQAWVVTDPMGENIDFLQTIAQNDLNSGLLAFTPSTNTLQWNLKDAIPVSTSNTTRTYTYSYRIGLDITANNFDFDKVYNTNKPTLLNYVMVENGVQGTTVLEGNFTIPKVKGKTINGPQQPNEPNEPNEPQEPKEPKEPKEANKPNKPNKPKNPPVGKWVKNPDQVFVPLVPKSGY